MNNLHIYTDGSCTSNGRSDAVAGWAFAVIQNDDLVAENFGRVSGQGTNNIGELQAILEALEYLIQHSDRKQQVHLYSDSSYCIKGITEWRHNWKRFDWHRSKDKTKILRNRELWIAIDALVTRLPPIQWTLVKGHSGNKWNEYVDYLAKSAVKEGFDED